MGCIKHTICTAFLCVRILSTYFRKSRFICLWQLIGSFRTIYPTFVVVFLVRNINFVIIIMINQSQPKLYLTTRHAIFYNCNEMVMPKINKKKQNRRSETFTFFLKNCNVYIRDIFDAFYTINYKINITSAIYKIFWHILIEL